MSKRYDYIVEVEKFNPYHGKDGRFTSANGAASFTYKPGGGKAYDKAIADEKMKSNPYRYMTNERLESKLSSTISERNQAWWRSHMKESEATKKIIATNKKKVARLDKEIHQMMDALDYFEKYGNNNTF